METNEQLDHDFDDALNRNYEPDDIAQPMYDGIQFVGRNLFHNNIRASTNIAPVDEGRNSERFRAAG